MDALRIQAHGQESFAVILEAHIMETFVGIWTSPGKAKNRAPPEESQQTCTHPRGGQQIRHVQEAQDV